ncbi:MAG: transketolase [Acidobacteriota bacterium]|nr:transketolase [Acidobacteriota bacterium]
MTSPLGSDLDQIAVNTIRFLAVDMVEKANSGHPGAPMGQAEMAYVLWAGHLKHNPTNPAWPNRDRFVLSCGHASALIYSLLHLSGYDLTLDDIKSFRQFESRTPGHPEHGLTPGVETTTGPLGQGISNAVGMAIGERMLAAHFNRENFPVIDYRTWVFASDGDLMEGVASEACSLAGHLGLGKLNVLWDDNRISIEGGTELAFTEDVQARFHAYGWHVVSVDDGHDLAAVNKAIQAAAAETSRPTLVRVRTHIGFGSPNKQDTASSHGSPLGSDEIDLTKKRLGWPQDPPFHIPDEAREAFAHVSTDGAAQGSAWNKMVVRWGQEHPDLASEFQRRTAVELPDGWEDALPSFAASDGALATRKASGKVLNAIASVIPELTGGSADLAGSNNTWLADEDAFSKSVHGGRNFHFGVREHAMGAIMNGLALTPGLIPYGGTFLVFSDYMRPAIRLAALMEIGVIYVFTHDSIFLGEDGPTHQPESHLASLRSIPGLTVVRPADANETAAAWRVAIERRHGPTALVLTRQKLPILAQTSVAGTEGVARGGYVLADPADSDPQLILIATGSEVSLALEAQAVLSGDGIPARVVSLPSWELFDAQTRQYRETVLPPSIPKRLAIEAAVSFGWERYVGDRGRVIGVDRFGASAPAGDLYEPFGLTAKNIADVAKRLL